MTYIVTVESRNGFTKSTDVEGPAEEAKALARRECVAALAATVMLPSGAVLAEYELDAAGRVRKVA